MTSYFPLSAITDRFNACNQLLLNLLAFIAHMLLERGDRLYQRCLATTSRRELWHTLRTAMHMLLVTAWADFLLIYLDETGPSP